MGIRFRKSINLGGGFRVNISKNGVGYSWGIPGYRITKTSKGSIKKTYSIPGTGIGYSEEKSKKNLSNKNSYPTQYNYNTIEDIYTNIDIANVNELRPAEFSDLISTLEKSLKYRKISTLLCLGLIGVLASNFILATIGIIGVLLKLILLYKGTPFIEYNLDEDSTREYNKTINSIKNLQACKKIWDITAESYISNQKINAGASRNVKRFSFKITSKIPSFMKTNVPTACMILSKKKIIFLPDKIFIIKNNKIGISIYKDLYIDQNYSRFIENEGVPSDTEIIAYTWQYVNKNGSPDRRFKNNKQLPICKYGNLRISDGSNLNIEIMCSDYSKSKLFSQTFLSQSVL